MDHLPSRFARLLLRPSALVLLLGVPQADLSAEHPFASEFADAYRSEIRPLLERYCDDCHGAADEVEGETNLAILADWEQAAKQPRTWELVHEMLSNRLMPPADADQPTEEELAKLRQWSSDFLKHEAQVRAGDPGRVVLRRLSNAEYAYTLRDLTGVESLDPAREFPADGAAGEGFTNVGSALTMSPSMVRKYLDSARDVAEHAVLLPEGLRFSPHTTARDWTDDIVAEIRAFYGEFTDSGGGSEVNLQGIVFETNQGGLLPVEKYLRATLVDRQALATRQKSIDEVAREHGLNAKYLGILWTALAGSEPSALLDELRSSWRNADEEDAAALAADIAIWQRSLWTFANVGLIGRRDGPKRWMEPLDPLATQQELRFKIPDAPADEDVVISIAATDAGDGNDGDLVIWKQAKLVTPGQPDLLLRDIRQEVGRRQALRHRLFSRTAAYLNVADEISRSEAEMSLAALADEHGLEEAALGAWLDYLGIGQGKAVALEGVYATKLVGVEGYDFVNGWGSSDTPLLVANSSDAQVRIPGTLEPHSVAVHPSPTLRAAVGWQSPVTATVSVRATITHAHPACGNGVTWALEVRRGGARRRLADGVAEGVDSVLAGPFEEIPVRAGDVVSLLIGPRDGSHACDLTAVDLVITCQDGADQRSWDLAKDVSGEVLAANPHADLYGNDGVWHFYSEPEGGDATGPDIPAESALAKWQAAISAEERRGLAEEVQTLLTGAAPTTADDPNAALFRQLTSMRGPLLGHVKPSEAPTETTESPASEFGLDPRAFGTHPNGRPLEAADLCVQAPSTIEIRLPGDLTAGSELVVTGMLADDTSAEGSVQLAIVAGTPALGTGLLRGESRTIAASGPWSSGDGTISNSAPVLVADGSAAQRRWQQAFADFRELFPPALCYTKIVPVDEVISVTLFYREDDHLVRLMLDDAQRARLEQLWQELHFVSRDALTSVDAFEQLMEFATQDADPTAFEPLRGPIAERAAAFRRLQVECEPKQLDALLAFAARAYRRPLTPKESRDVSALYDGLRRDDIPHDEAFRVTLARILAAPAFLYRIEKPAPGAGQGPVSDWELASRLSYFLWASLPDDELRAMAADGRLKNPDVLVAQTRRMLDDAKIRRLAKEFACHWLEINDFEHLDEKSERHFPTFAGLRSAMAEESILFLTDLFQNGGSVLDILDADYAFLNEDLAAHYGVPGVSGEQWRRVDGVKQYSRGGVLAQATTLAKQSGASRTSPILRGTWISEALLGERLPDPPPGVPPLPEDESATDGLTVRQLVEKHVSDPACAGCHRRIDPYGFSLEAFDAIGRLRDTDLGARKIDARVTVMDGASFEGLDGLRRYLLTERRDAFVQQFCRKLLGYALGRTVQLSDEPLLADMQHALAENDFAIETAVEAIVLSPQFREIRGADHELEDLELEE